MNFSDGSGPRRSRHPASKGRARSHTRACAISAQSKKIPRKQKSFRIAIIEDDAEIFKLINDLIRFHFENSTLILFQDGKTAWQQLQQLEVDCLITDMEHPGMSGWEMLPFLAQKRVAYPVLVITPYAEASEFTEPEKVREFQRLIQSVKLRLKIKALPKPFENDVFRSALKTLLENH